MRYTGFFLMALAILAITVLAACGGGADDPGGSGSTSTSPPSQATPASPTTASQSPAPSTRAASTSSQTSRSASTGAPSSDPTSVAPGPTSPPEPTDAPARPVLPAPVTMPDCGSQFRQMLVDYDGVEEFGGEVVTRLSGEFVELRPDCLVQGWDPEFPADPLVCHESGDLPGSIVHKTNDRSPTQYVSPTQRVELDQNFAEVGRRTQVQINIHLNRVPLLSDVPERLGSPGSGLVGGCWHYKGIKDLSGHWAKSFIKYTTKTKRSGKVGVRRVSGPIVVLAPASFPECDSLFQSVLSKGLDSGEVYDSSGVGDAVDMSRALSDGVCGLKIGPYRGWRPSPVDGPAQGCPVMAPTGVQGDGTFVLHWPEEDHYDVYGASACWVRNADGEWGAYLEQE